MALLEKLKVSISARDTNTATTLKRLERQMVTTTRTVSMLNRSMLSTFKGAALTAFSAVGVASLGAFTKECLELGSSLTEVQNVVDTTFPNMSDSIEDWSQSAMESFGLSETMAKQYASTMGAMAESMGFAEDAAYEMATAMTELTGDVSSFYNLDAESAYNKLKAVFTGETEGLKSLGVVMTQTALDEYALAEGMGKTTAKMTEAEKVGLRYKFVLNALSKASGDFAKTSESWANQTRIAQLRIESIKASIGQGLINAFTPALKMVNQLLAYVETLAAKFRTFTELVFGAQADSGSAASVTVSDAVANNLTTAQKAAEATKAALAGFHELNVISSGKSSEAGDTGVQAASVAITPATSGAIREATSGGISEKMQKLADATRRLLDAAAPIAGAVGKGFLGFFGDLFDKLSGGKSATEVLDDISNWLEGVDPEQAEKFGRTLGGIVSDLLILAGIGTIDVKIAFALGFGWSIGQLINEAIGEDPVSMTELGVEIGTELMDGTFSDTVFGFAEDSWRSFWDSIWQSIQEEELFTQLVPLVEDVFSGVFDMFPGWQQKFEENTKRYDQIFKWLVNEFQREVENLKGLGDDISKSWTGLKQGVTSLREKVVNAFEQMRLGVNRFTSSVTSVASSIFEAFRQGLPQGKLEGYVGGIFKGAVNAAIDQINDLVGLVSGRGVSIFGKDLTISMPQIPHLAAGGLITGPTMAALGEGGHREAVLPLEQNTGWMQTLAQMLSTQTQVNVNITGDMGKLFQAIQTESRNYSARTGRPAFNT